MYTARDVPLPRLIATDLDGTLLRDDGKVSGHTRDVLQRAIDAGIHIVPVTGRPVRRLRPIARELGLVGVAVCANGALLYDLASDAVVEQTLLSAEVARELIVGLRAA